MSRTIRSGDLNVYVRLLAVREEMRVLDVGTGTGYPAALLAELVGAKGRVVSLDIDASLVARAEALHAQRGVRGVETVTADGHYGYASRAPYDRIISWTAPLVLPGTWTEQTRPGGIIVSAVHLAPLAGVMAVVRAVVTPGRDVPEISLHRGTYPPMRPGAEPGPYTDATREHSGDVMWLSSEGLRGDQDGGADDLLSALLSPRHQEGALYEHHDDVARRVGAAHIMWRDFQYFLLARRTTNTITCRLPAKDELSLPVSAVGLGHGREAAVLTEDGRFLASRTKTRALTELHELFSEWADAGRPGMDSLTPRVHPVPEGWKIRLTPSAAHLDT